MDSKDKGESGSRYRLKRNSFANSDRVKNLLRLLEGLAEKTDPAGGDDTARQKDERAFIAIGLAARLVDEVAGWAIDHQVGLALKNLAFVPLGHPETRDAPEYVRARRQVDSHDHELAGFEATRLEPLVQRQALINILSASDGFLPSDLCASVVRALRGLNHGDQSPIFFARTASAKRSLRERELMLKAVGYVAYKCGQGIKQNVAKADVFNAYDVAGQKAYEEWKRNSRQIFGDLVVKRTIRHGEIAGFNARSRRLKPVPTDLFGEILEKEFGEEALAKDAEEFRQLRAMASNRGARRRKARFAHPAADDLKGAKSSEEGL